MGREAEQSGLRSEPLHPLAITDKTAQISPDLLGPNYRIDARLIEERGDVTVFIAPGYETIREHGTSDVVPGAIYNHSDRLVQGFGLDEYKEASGRARELVGNARSARYFEELLRILYGSPQAELVHIVVGVSRSTGHSYRLFGTINPSEVRKAVSKKRR